MSSSKSRSAIKYELFGVPMKIVEFLYVNLRVRRHTSAVKRTLGIHQSLMGFHGAMVSSK